MKSIFKSHIRNDLAETVINESSISIHKSGYVHCLHQRNINLRTDFFSYVYYIVDGKSEIICNDKKFEMVKDHVYLFPANSTIKKEQCGESKFLFFYINLYDIRNIDILTNCQPTDGIKVDNIPEIIKLYNSNDTIDALMLKQIILKDCLKFLKMSGCQISIKSYSDIVRKALDYIKYNLSIKLSVKEMCEKLFISSSTLNYCFKKEVGKSVGQYIDDLILKKAEMMLIKDNVAMSEISELLGFCDQFYFSRKFKEKYGETPSSYRKRLRNEFLQKNKL